MPTPDPLEIPELPENPTQHDVGRVSYYYNCMPCHGDHGQGLTDEWRSVWEEDHQNCWASGCHGGRAGEQGFPIPTAVPALIGPEAKIPDDPNPLELHDYLATTHPPQNPGVLPADEYWALTAYLLIENGRLSPEKELEPNTIHAAEIDYHWLPMLLIVGAGAALVLVVRKRRRSENSAI